ncbi:hypothetical protein [uncultured Roseovarius sp.]|uniref:hypothetical protein n=1 Tax=uncultured Roseovarius sp. TaxID=293344 RepID=UPI002608E0C8|nr:hypothetical protein [uncultured Roseovarius sp.]
MTIYKLCADLLNDIENFSKQQNFPNADDLLRDARAALNEDLQNQIKRLSGAAQKPEAPKLSQRHH